MEHEDFIGIVVRKNLGRATGHTWGCLAFIVADLCCSRNHSRFGSFRIDSRWRRERHEVDEIALSATLGGLEAVCSSSCLGTCTNRTGLISGAIWTSLIWDVIVEEALILADTWIAVESSYQTEPMMLATLLFPLLALQC